MIRVQQWKRNKKKGPGVRDSILQVSTGLMADERWEWEEGGILDTKEFLAVSQAELAKSG